MALPFVGEPKLATDNFCLSSKEFGMLDRSRRCVLALSLFGMTLLAVACGQNTGTSTPGQDIVQAGAHALSDQTPPAADEKEIMIDNFSFAPAELTVAAGSKVTWVNRDDVPHTATSSGKPRQFDSGTLDTDGRFSHVFTTPGTFPYFCAVHPRMVGQVIVK
jgi:plastocyanin